MTNYNSEVVRKSDVQKYLDDNFISAEYIEVSAKENLYIEKIYTKILDFTCSLINSYDTETLKVLLNKKIEKVRSFFYLSRSNGSTMRLSSGKRNGKCCIIS